MLIDIKKSWGDITCVKKNMYDPEIKYIALSYRWGEFEEEQVITPDYIACHTSSVSSLQYHCQCICNETSFKEINYLWVDIISINQNDHEKKKKEAMFKMHDIYNYATFILAVPDLHSGYLWKNTANQEILTLLSKYRKIIANDIQYYQQQQQLSFFKKIKKNIMINNELKRAYRFLAYLINDWIHRTWVLSECQIAKEKYKKYRTPLKYTFQSILGYDNQVFFSYHFDNDDDDQQQQQHETEDEIIYDRKLRYDEVTDAKKLIQFIKEIDMNPSHLNIILDSNVTRHEYRFHAILPLWNKYKHIIQTKNTISQWNITDINSVRVKLYDFMDLWDKAVLLRACSPSTLLKIRYPIFASQYDLFNMNIVEKCDYNNDTYKEFEEELFNYINRNKEENDIIQIKQLINEYKTNSKPIWTDNLIRIQLNKDHHQYYLSVTSKSYFIRNIQPDHRDHWVQFLSLDDHDELQEVFIPYLTLAIPGEDLVTHPIYSYYLSINLVGNKHKNKWILAFDS